MGKVSKRPNRANRTRIQWDRQFLGKVKDFESKEEEKQERKHLKAYLQGKEYFKYGWKDILNPRTQIIERYPNLIEVKQVITPKIKSL